MPPGGQLFRSLKVQLLPPLGHELNDDVFPAGLTPDLLVAWYLSWVLDRIKRGIEKYFPGGAPKLSLNMAAPMDHMRIRANQGHSVPVDLGLVPIKPPELLFHGTVARFLPSIRQEGLVRGKRHHVHLSPDAQTAQRVGGRRGRPIILVIEAGRMSDDPCP